MTQDAFAGRHTQEKLDAIEEYIGKFITVLKRQKYELIYFDAFAGTGEIPVANNNEVSLFEIEDVNKIIEGSAERALKYPFDYYYFVEKNESKFRELFARYGSLASEKNIQFLHGDANFHLKNFVEKFDSRRFRAIVFLDPFGNQIPMDTLKLLASKPGIDVWYLFPAGLGVDRQIGKNGEVYFEHEKSLDRLLGDGDWRKVLITEISEPDLFGENRTTKFKQSDPDEITKYMINKLKDVFEGRVLSDWLPLGGNNRHWYSLLFMWSNSSESAKVAERIAKGVLKKSLRIRHKSNGRRK